MGCLIGYDGRIRDLNDALARALGASIEELTGGPIIDLIHPDDRPATLAIMRALMEAPQGAPLLGPNDDRFENRIRRSDGSYLRVTWTSVTVPERELFYASARPLTDIEVSLRRLRALADALPHFVGLSDRADHVVYVNPAGRAMLGMGPDEALPTTRRENLTPRAIELFDRAIVPAVKRDGLWKGETEVRHKDGSVIPVERLVVSVRDEAGRHVSIASMVRDIREEKGAEEALARFKALAESTSDLVGTAAVTGQPTYVNPAGMAMLGRAGESFEGLKLRDVLPRVWKRRFLEEVFPTVLEKGLWTGESDLLRADGSLVPVSHVVLLIRDERGDAHSFGTIARDMTEQKELERALERALRELSTPILRMGRGVVALPIIGRLDEARAAQMTEALLQAIVASHARVAVLDMTGAEAEDDDVTPIELLLKTASAVSLLGSRCFLCGLSPKAAGRIAAAAPDLPHARTFATLADALRAAAALAGR